MSARRSRQRTAVKYELHEHHFVSGPRANGGYAPDGTWLESTFSHSHEGGEVSHRHPNTGPASYVIDKDEWAMRTGMRGGGRKTFTTKPTGEQFPLVELDDSQRSFDIVVCQPTPSKGQPGYIGEGPGIALPMRMVLQFRMRVASVTRG